MSTLSNRLHQTNGKCHVLNQMRSLGFACVVNDCLPTHYSFKADAALQVNGTLYGVTDKPHASMRCVQLITFQILTKTEGLLCRKQVR